MTNQEPVPILLYHTISEAPSPKLSGFAVHPRQFREQMTLVRDSGRRPITAGALVDSLGTPEPDTNVVVVTFDDGYRDFLEVALPIMADLGIDSSLYVTSGWLADADPATRDRGPSDPMLAATDLPQLRSSGVEIGAHSRTHPQMDTLDPDQARTELAGSKDALEDALSEEVRSFAYPHGFQSPGLRRQAKEVGYSFALGVRNALSCTRDDPYNIARLTVTAQTTNADVAGWLNGVGAPLVSSRELMRTRGFRAARRLRAKVTGRPATDWG
jgi:peptidoglycan/xylan/chitin deacetylase (PgdA/CDA1 family)